MIVLRCSNKGDKCYTDQCFFFSKSWIVLLDISSGFVTLCASSFNTPNKAKHLIKVKNYIRNIWKKHGTHSPITLMLLHILIYHFVINRLYPTENMMKSYSVHPQNKSVKFSKVDKLFTFFLNGSLNIKFLITLILGLYLIRIFDLVKRRTIFAGRLKEI